MTQEEAIAENQRAMAALLCPRDAELPTTAPVYELTEELRQAVKDVRERGYVARELNAPDMLIRALSAPTMVQWAETSEEKTRDPVSGKMVPARRLKSVAGLGCEALHTLKHELEAFVRAMSAHAKRIGSPSFTEWRAAYLTLEVWFAQHNMINPLEPKVAEEVVHGISAALFVLWADNEIEKEVCHD